MNSLKVGFSRVNITPPHGAFVAGYFIDRFADGVLDELEASAVAFAVGEKRAVLLTADLCEVPTPVANYLINKVMGATGLSRDEILFVVSHSHTSPEACLRAGATSEVSASAEMLGAAGNSRAVNEVYTEAILATRLADAAVMALADLKPAKMGWKTDKAEGIAFVRRFLMKDGSIRTNPGLNNPDIVSPVGHVDDGVGIVRIDREGGDTVVLVNYGNHADTVGGCKITADWPGFLRKTVEKSLDGVKCVFVNGAEGDVGHVNVFAKHGDLNDLTIDFDDVLRGYGHARYMGRVVAAAVLRGFDKVNYVDCDRLITAQREMLAPSNMPTPEELPEAKRIYKLHTEGRDDLIPFEGMMLTTVVAEAGRMVALENGPENFKLTLSTLALGPVAFLGVPGEPFTGIGEALKKAEGFDMVMPASFANGYEGYFPMMSAYEEGGYESRSSLYRKGVGEKMIEEGLALLSEVKR